MHNFCEAAVEAVKDKFEWCGLKDAEDRKVFVAAILGSTDEQVATNWPFLWMLMNGEDWIGEIKEYECKVRAWLIMSVLQFPEIKIIAYQGLFLSCMVMKTLSLHVLGQLRTAGPNLAGDPKLNIFTE